MFSKGSLLLVVNNQEVCGLGFHRQYSSSKILVQAISNRKCKCNYANEETYGKYSEAFYLQSLVLTLSHTSPGFYMSAVQVFWKQCGERKNCSCFLPIWRTFCHLHQIWNCRLQTLWVWKSLNLVVWDRVNSLQNDKTLEKSKVMSVADEKVNATQKLKWS